MSNLASKLQKIDPATATPQRRGPTSACFDVYGYGDLDDWREVRRLKDGGMQWSDIQAHVDSNIDLKRKLDLEKFKYHWRQRCFCWRGTAA